MSEKPWRVLHRQIGVALLMEELVEALDTAQAGVRTRQGILDELLREAEKDDPEGELAGWDREAQVDYRRTVYSQTLYRSLFVMFWAALEQMLSDVCEDLRGDRHLLLKEHDLSGKGVKRAVKYIRKVAGVELDLCSLGWEDIVRYGDLRNHFVHVGSNADDASSPKKAREKFARIPSVELEPNGEIVLGHAFLETALGKIHLLLNGVVLASAQR